MGLEQIGAKIISCAIQVHRTLGPGLLESSYEASLKWELEQAGLSVRSQVGLPLVYGEVQLDVGYRIDLLVEGQIIIELKAVESINPVHLAQILTYLKLNNSKLSYLMNFNVTLMKHGIRRVVHDYWNHEEQKDFRKGTKKSS